MMLTLFALSFYATWTFYALIYYGTTVLNEDYLMDNETWTKDDRCIEHVHDFSSAFLFSLETQHTIG